MATVTRNAARLAKTEVGPNERGVSERPHIELKKIETHNPAAGQPSSGTTLQHTFAVRVGGEIQPFLLIHHEGVGAVECNRRLGRKVPNAQEMADAATGRWLKANADDLAIISGCLTGQWFYFE